MSSKRYKCALNRKRVNSLLDVKHKPQENPSCVTAYGGSVREKGGRMSKLPEHKTEVYVLTREKGVYEYVTIREYKREYDNPDVSDTFVDSKGKLQWNNATVYSNFEQTMKLVSMKNNPKHRERWAMPLAERDYVFTLKEANICHCCKRPIVTQKALVKTSDSGGVFDEILVGKIKSHYELAKDSATGKFIFVYVDGTKRVILSRKRKHVDRFGKEHYFDTEFYDKYTGETVHPQSEYFTDYLKCNCGMK